MAGFTKLLFFFAISIGCALAIPKPLFEKPECIHDYHELWSHTNPNEYWYCDSKGVAPKPMKCDSGRGFLRIENVVSGCVPWSEWKCTSKTGPPSCAGDNYNKPHRHVNPNKFWACTQEIPSRPVEADCLDWPITGNPPSKGTRGFVDNVNNLGCVPWNVWVCDKADNNDRE